MTGQKICNSEICVPDFDEETKLEQDLSENESSAVSDEEEQEFVSRRTPASRKVIYSSESEAESDKAESAGACCINNL